MPVTQETIWPTISIADIGKVMLAVVNNYEICTGRTLSAASETLSLSEQLKHWGEGVSPILKYLLPK